MGTISTLSVNLTANTKGLQKGLTKGRRAIKRFTKSVLSVKGAVLGAFGVAGLAGALTAGLVAFRKQEQAIASLSAANQSMGRTTKGLTDDLVALASQIQREGIIGDEAIIQGQSFLSTFGQIPNELLPRATRAMVDLMAKTGQSGQAAANMIGKAAMGLSGALRIAGITLSDSTMAAIENEKKIKQMGEQAGIKLKDMNRESRIFKMILKDIESQIGGTNKALAKTDTGALDQLKNSAGDLKEKFGEIKAIGFSPFARQLSADIDNANINVKALGLSFREWLFTAAEGVGALVNKFNGIILVIKTLKLGFLGFGLLVTDILRGITTDLNNLFSFFGSDYFSNISGELTDSFNSQMANISNLKSEIGGLYSDIEAGQSGNALQSKINDFLKRARDTERKLHAPEITRPETRPGGFDKLIIDPGKSSQRVIIDKSPQIDRSNQLLEQIAKKSGVAIAG